MSLESLRAAVPGARSSRFLNYAATALLPAPSAEAMTAVAREGCEPMARHFTAWMARIEAVRGLVAGAIGASPEEVAFAGNTSTALSLIAAAVRWRPGDRVLYPADEFPSNRYVWQNLAELGVEAEAVPPEPELSFAEQLAARDLERVRLVALSEVSYRDGRRADVAEVVRVCRPRGVLVAVDAIQAAGAVPVDVRASGCDFLACGGQKWLLGPVGSGFLYIAAGRLEELHAPLVGWASSRDAGDFDAERLEPCAGARRLEPGWPDVAAIAGLGRSLELLRDAGWKEVFARIEAHRERLGAALHGLGLRLLHDGPARTRSGIVAVALPPGLDAGALEAGLDARNVLVTIRGGHLRIAPHALTPDEDLDVLLEVLADHLPAARPAVSVSETRRAEAPSATADRGRPGFRLAVITGAGRGLGEAIAGELAGRGCALILVSRDAGRLDAVAARLAAEHGVEVEAAPLDLADPAAVRAWIAERQARLAVCDVLVNAAAWAEAEPFALADLERWRRMIETNALAPAALTRAVLDGMLERGRGAILNVVTAGARGALPLFAGYAASKGALWAWSEALAHELHGTGVRLTLFLPPHMPTATQKRLGRTALAHYDVGAGDDSTVPPRAVAEAAVRALEEGTPAVVPWRTRWSLALNALAPRWVARRVRKALRR